MNGSRRCGSGSSRLGGDMDRQEEHRDALVPEVLPPGSFEAWRKREQELAGATTPEQLIEYKAKMAAIGRYFGMVKRNFAATQEAMFYWLRACRKLGTKITKMQLKPGRPKKVTEGNHSQKVKTLEDYGITKRDAHKWRRL